MDEGELRRMAEAALAGAIRLQERAPVFDSAVHLPSTTWPLLSPFETRPSPFSRSGRKRGRE